jgi:hypothetical protein
MIASDNILLFPTPGLKFFFIRKSGELDKETGECNVVSCDSSEESEEKRVTFYSKKLKVIWRFH